MIPEDRQKMNDLCKRIQEEKDPTTFDRLIRELDELLSREDQQIHQQWKKTGS